MTPVPRGTSAREGTGRDASVDVGYAKGKPVGRVEQVKPGALANLSDEELRSRLVDAAKELTPEE